MKRLDMPPWARLSATVAAVLLLGFATDASAGFIASVSGSAAIIAPPASAIPFASESDEYQVWEETSGVFAADLHVDHAGQAGSYDGLSDYSTLGTVLAKGTAYASTFIHLDAKTVYPLQQPIATITFTHKIIGLALFGVKNNPGSPPTPGSLDNSDVYGSPGTTYPTGLPTVFLQTRGIDFHHYDRFSISTDGKALTLQLTSGIISIDQIRVFTEAPEPASLAVWSVIGVISIGSGLLRRRRFTVCLLQNAPVPSDPIQPMADIDGKPA